MRHRQIKVRRYSDSNRPQLKFVVGYHEAGKQKRKFFESKEQAQSFAAFKNAELKRHGIAHAEFPERLRIMAQNAVERLQPFKKTIDDAVEHYVAHLEATERSCTAVELVKELIRAKERDGSSFVHLKDLRCRLNIFAAKFDGQPVATITNTAIDDWLRSLPVGASHAQSLSAIDYSGVQLRCWPQIRGHQSGGGHGGSARAKDATGDSHGRSGARAVGQRTYGDFAVPRHRTLCRIAPG